MERVSITIKTKSNFSEKKVWIYLLFLIPFFEPTYFAQIYIVHQIYIFTKVLFAVLIFIQYLYKRKINTYIIGIILYFLLKLLITIYYNPAYSFTYLFTVIIQLALILFIDMAICEEPESILHALTILLGTLVIVNFILLLVFPNGIYVDAPLERIPRPGHLLGMDNQLALILIPVATISVIYSQYKYNRIKPFALIIMCIITSTIFITWSATAVVSIFIFICLFIIANISRRYALLTFKQLALSYIIIWFFVVVFQQMELFQEFIENYFGKNATLSNRIYLWEIAFKKVGQSLWFGYGNIASGRLVPFYNTTYEAHNVILQTLLESGIIGFLFLCALICLVGRKLQRYRKHSLTKYIIIGIFSVLITFLTESYSTMYLFILLTIGYHIEALIYCNNRDSYKIESVKEKKSND